MYHSEELGDKETDEYAEVAYEQVNYYTTRTSKIR